MLMSFNDILTCSRPILGEKLVFTGVNIDQIINEKIVEHGGAANVFDTFWAE